MSFKTGRLLRRLRSGVAVFERVHCERLETVLDTFTAYDFRIVAKCVGEQMSNLRSLPKYGRDDRCWAYLWSANLNGNTYYKVGVTGNLYRRFSHFVGEFPPVANIRAEAALLFDDVIFAEKCEFSVLASCVDLWVGGEWLCEAGAGKAVATDGR